MSQGSFLIVVLAGAFVLFLANNARLGAYVNAMLGVPAAKGGAGP